MPALEPKTRFEKKKENKKQTKRDKKFNKEKANVLEKYSDLSGTFSGLRLNEIKPEVFEAALRDAEIHWNPLTYNYVYPTNCKMLISQYLLLVMYSVIHFIWWNPMREIYSQYILKVSITVQLPWQPIWGIRDYAFIIQLSFDRKDSSAKQLHYCVSVHMYYRGSNIVHLKKIPVVWCLIAWLIVMHIILTDDRIFRLMIRY